MEESQKQPEPRLLPVLDIHGKEFVIDVESRKFRDVDDSENAVKMHSVEGRRIVRGMLGMEWRVYRVDRGQMAGVEV